MPKTLSENVVRFEVVELKYIFTFTEFEQGITLLIADGTAVAPNDSMPHLTNRQRGVLTRRAIEWLAVNPYVPPEYDGPVFVAVSERKGFRSVHILDRHVSSNGARVNNEQVAPNWHTVGQFETAGEARAYIATNYTDPVRRLEAVGGVYETYDVS